MKKVFGLLAAAAVLSSGVSFAQDQDSHDVNVKIPDVLRIRLVDSAQDGGLDANVAVANPTPVEFDFETFATAFDVDRSFYPSNTGSFNWDDIRVFSNDPQGWSVSVATDNNSFVWSKVKVEVAQGTNASDFDLGGGEIATNAAKTGGWESLGVDPENFTIEFDGSEDAGEYTTTVTYSIVGL